MRIGIMDRRCIETLISFEIYAQKALNFKAESCFNAHLSFMEKQNASVYFVHEV